MASMLNRNRFGAHGDVMSAKPEDEAGKATLLEEIKSRARCVNGGRGASRGPASGAYNSTHAAVRVIHSSSHARVRACLSVVCHLG